MQNISNWIMLIASTITSIITILGFLNKMLDFKFKDFYNNQRLHLRYEICSFSGDLRNGIHKTRDEFQAIFAMEDIYDKLIKKLKQHNHYIDNEMEYIKQQYKLLK